MYGIKEIIKEWINIVYIPYFNGKDLSKILFVQEKEKKA